MTKTVANHMLLVILMVMELLEHFIKKIGKEISKRIQDKEKIIIININRIIKTIKSKNDELYVKWKGYGNLFNS